MAVKRKMFSIAVWVASIPDKIDGQHGAQSRIVSTLTSRSDVVSSFVAQGSYHGDEDSAALAGFAIAFLAGFVSDGPALLPSGGAAEDIYLRMP
ncbi:hypothetical protein LMG29660_02714 [Burkholderia puraquae]|uniref:Uncharacterized protein n=1 Tax=Burkholderia puraquae TaxID=1904757 RepID=A0A6J5DNS0_9BURK|nr:hypothetical protein [Burkholderia puraquae]CAB3755910.1 hypothetical protein LMG29660_02714 [Burkholderia puraquae]